MPLTTKGTPYVVSTDLVANYPTVSSDLADHIDDNLQYNAQDINAQTGSGANAYTFALADASLYKLVTASNAAAATYTVPPQSSVTWATGAVLRILNQGAGVVTLAGGSGVTLNGSVLTLTQYQYAEIHRTASNTWTVIGIATPPGLVKIVDQTFTSASSLNIDNVFTSTYDNYFMTVLLTGSSTNLQLRARTRLSGSDDTGNNYYTSEYYIGTTGAAAGNTVGAVASSWAIFDASDSTDTNNCAFIDIADPLSGKRKNMVGLTHQQNPSAVGYGYSKYFNKIVTTNYDGLTIFTSTGTASGKIRIYGYRD